MFENLSITQKQLLYQALKALIETGEGVGFHNADMGHPAYAIGSQGKDSSQWGDSPKKNMLFQMVSELSNDFKKRGEQGYVWWVDLSDWQKFCAFAFDIYNKKRTLKQGKP